MRAPTQSHINMLKAKAHGAAAALTHTWSCHSRCVRACCICLCMYLCMCVAVFVVIVFRYASRFAQK